MKLFEIGAMALAAIGFHTHDTALLLVVLFLMGLHSTTFGPIKYAILPQALRPTELVGGNGLVEMGTQLAMLIGMIAGNSLMLVAGLGPWLASAATIARTVASTGSPSVRAASAACCATVAVLDVVCDCSAVIARCWRAPSHDAPPSIGSAMRRRGCFTATAAPCQTW